MNQFPVSPSPAVHVRATPVDPIGLFDSGVGGLTVLDALRRRLPRAPALYVGDVSHSPYGNRPAHEVVARSAQVVAWLVAAGARTIVVPCNTATALAIDTLRDRWPALAFVGVEPGVKPAVARSRTGRIAVMATTGTVESARLRHLVLRHAGDAHVHLQACPGLASAIEGGLLGGPRLLEVLRPYCQAIRAAEVDVVVLGCTHYPFVADAIRSLLGEGIALVDTADAVADRIVAIRGEVDAPSANPTMAGDAAANGPWTLPPLTRVCSTGATATMQALLDRCAHVAPVRVESVTVAR